MDVEAGDGVLQQAAVAFAHGLPIDAVHARVIEVVALETPGIREELLPLAGRVDDGFHAGKAHLFVELLVFFGLDDCILGFAADQEFVVFRREHRIIHVVKNGFALPFFEVVEIKGAAFFGGTGGSQLAVE